MRAREYTDGMAPLAILVYSITKTLTGHFTSKSTVVKDKNRKVLMTEEEYISTYFPTYGKTL